MWIQRNTNKQVHEWAPGRPLQACSPGAPSGRPLRARPLSAPSGRTLRVRPPGMLSGLTLADTPSLLQGACLQHAFFGLCSLISIYLINYIFNYKLFLFSLSPNPGRESQLIVSCVPPPLH